MPQLLSATLARLQLPVDPRHVLAGTVRLSHPHVSDSSSKRLQRQRLSCELGVCARVQSNLSCLPVGQFYARGTDNDSRSDLLDDYGFCDATIDPVAVGYNTRIQQ